MTRPNILFIHSDQHRADALSIEGHPDLMTPNLDEIAGRGAWFRNAYTPTPICCPARRTLLTGHTPATDGCLSNHPVRIPMEEDTLPNLLRLAGYQTVDIGRSFHQYPTSKRYGFEFTQHSPWHSHDSRAWLEMRPLSQAGEFTNWPHLLMHGLPLDGYTARSWPYDEAFHQTTWTINKAIDFLDHRDPESPFFLSVGTVAPHPPLLPPAFYYDRYNRLDLAPPAVGDWAVEPARNARGMGSSWSCHVPLGGLEIHCAMAGYYGLINHLDDQLFNLRQRINYLNQPTYIIYLSDHGEMLGDHHCFSKMRPYQGALRVPFLMQGPDIPAGIEIDAPIALQDFFPTVCELAGLPIPSHVEGRSLIPLLHGDSKGWRDCVHSEQPNHSAPEAFHCLTDGKWKYIWFSKTGKEQLFHLKNDPKELVNLSANEEAQSVLSKWRDRLAEEIQGRSEGFVANGKLVHGRPHVPVLPNAVPLK